MPDLEAEEGGKCEERKKGGGGAAFQGVPGGVPGGGTRKTHPPLLVLFSCNYDHLSFDKSQLVVVVGLAVVDGLHPAGFGLPLDTQKSLRNKHGRRHQKELQQLRSTRVKGEASEPRSCLNWD